MAPLSLLLKVVQNKDVKTRYKSFNNPVDANFPDLKIKWAKEIEKLAHQRYPEIRFVSLRIIFQKEERK